MDATNIIINDLLEKLTKEQLFDDLYYACNRNLELQDRVKELEEKLEMILNLNKNLLDKINSHTKDDALNIRILKSELDVDYEQLEIMFRFLPENKYFESEFQIIHDFFPTDVQKEKFKDLKNKLYKILVDNHLKKAFGLFFYHIESIFFSGRKPL